MKRTSLLSVSVVIPAYNAAATISNTLNALLHQTTLPQEILVIDDGSKDSTKTIVQNFVKRNKIIKLISQANAGPAKARNLGAKQAKNDIVVFTDSDCTPLPRFIEELVKPFADSSVAGVQGAYLTKQKEWTARFCQLEIEDRYDRLEKSMRDKGSIDFVGSYAAAYRRKLFLNENGFDTSFPIASGEDTDFSYRLARKGHRLVFAPAAKTYHLHPNTWWKYFKSKQNRAKWRNLLYKKNPEKMMKDSYTPQRLKFQIGMAWIAGSAIVSSILLTLAAFVVPNYWFSLISYFTNLAAFVAVLLFLILSLPQVIKNSSKDLWIGIITPFFELIRSLAFIDGLGQGLYLWLKKE